VFDVLRGASQLREAAVAQASGQTVDYATVPMERSRLRGRFDLQVLSPAHLAHIEFLDAKSSSNLLQMTSPWVTQAPPFRHAYFSNVATTPIAGYRADEIQQMKRWFYQRGVPFQRRVFLSWDHSTAAITTWKMVVRYWNVFWHPSSDDLFIFDESQSWLLFLWHEEQAFFWSAQKPFVGPSAAARSPGRRREFIV
jgi:hypothetical protein